MCRHSQISRRIVHESGSSAENAKQARDTAWTQEGGNLSEKYEPSELEIAEAMRDGWNEWHSDHSPSLIPEVSPAYRRGFRDAVRWMEAKGEK